MGSLKPIDFDTKQQLEQMDIGQLVRKIDKVGVYAGIDEIQVCNCLCENIFPLPVILYLSEDGNIQKEVIYSLDYIKNTEIIEGVSTIQQVNPENINYVFYKKLANRLIPTDAD